MPTITFIHTSPVHIATFERLVAERDSTIPLRHLVNEALLNDARAEGLTPAIATRVEQAVQHAAEDSAVVVCTCSTIGGYAEEAGRTIDTTVQRIDRAMAERAIAAGNRVVVVAALASTIAPTRALLEDAAQRVGQPLTLIDVVCEEAWSLFEQGNQAGYLAAIAACVRSVADQGDAVVLAQASMAGAAALCADLPQPILSSPALGVEAAISAYYQTLDSTTA